MSDFEIQWNELPTEPRPGTIWVQGVPSPQQKTLVALLGELYCASGWASLPIAFIPDGFQSYSGFYLILTALRRASQEVGQLIEKYNKVMREICPALLPLEEQADLPATLTSEFITSGVTRRVNRETYRLCHLIDQSACLLLEAVEVYARPHGQVALLMANYDWIDRPTLKILSRAQILGRRQASIHLVGLGETQFHRARETTGGSVKERIHQGRMELFQRLQVVLCPTVLLWPGTSSPRGDMSSPPGDTSSPPTQMPSSPKVDRWAVGVGQEIAQLNFDRALLLADTMAGSSEPDDPVHSHRLLGIIEAQLGHYEQAFQEFSQATTLTGDRHLQAHLHYLMGLLLTKRLYDFDQAEEYYQRGLASLKEADPEDLQTKLEQAWLHNGLCLLEVLRTKLLPGAEQPEKLLAILRRQMDISASLANAPSPGALYLRYNVFANMATLLALLGQGEQATKCWREIFEHHFGARGHHPEFDRRIRYHIGMFLLQAGRWKESLEQLNIALTAARRELTRLDEERIRVALGVTYYHSQEYDAARNNFGEGAKLAFGLRNWSAFGEHVSGVLWANVHLLNIEDFWTSVEQVSSIPLSEPFVQKFTLLKKLRQGRESLSSLLREAEITLPVPPIALPASIASIDLEAMPSVSAATLIGAKGIRRISTLTLTGA